MYELRRPGRRAEMRPAVRDLAPAPRAQRGAAPVHHRITQLVPVRDAPPLQRMKWTWVAAKSNWEDSSGKPFTGGIGPPRKGSYDGEVYDDGNQFPVTSDPTATPFLKTGEQFIGSSAVEKQSKGKAPEASDVRVSSVKPPGSTFGFGLHEVLPTDTRGKVASSGNPALIGLQSGLRTSTGTTFFRRPSEKEVGAHTGALPKPSGPGSTHTKGQPQAHDELRKSMDSIITSGNTDPDEVANAMLLAQLKVQATGSEFLSSAYLTGANSPHGTIGPPPSPGQPVDPVRLKIASEIHDRREAMKERGRSHKRDAESRGRSVSSPSPPRRRLTATGTGGEPETVPRTQFPTLPLPSFPGSRGTYQYPAQLGTWLSQPMRFDPSGTVPAPSPIVAPTIPSGTTTTTTLTTLPTVPVAPTPVPVTPTPMVVTPTAPTPTAPAGTGTFTVGTAPPKAKKKRRKRKGW